MIPCILESDYNTYIPWAKDSIANAVYPCSIAEGFQSGDIYVNDESNVESVFFWHNVWMLILPLIDWLIMTVALINTEEKWLLDLYGDEYARYKKQVNRCIPWKRKVR